MSGGENKEYKAIPSSCEKERQIEALTAVVASQHAEIIRCHERINDLLKANNEFEGRARKSERRLRSAQAWVESLPIGQPLMQNGHPIDHTELNNLKDPI